MKYWHDFLDSLGTDGGRIFCLFILVLVGVWLIHWNFGDTGRDMLSGAFGALLLALKTTGTNKQQQNGDKL